MNGLRFRSCYIGLATSVLLHRSWARDYARMTSRMPSPLCLAFVLVFSGMARAADAPRRVASFNLCADQLVVALADPEQITGLSPYAANPGLSIVA